MPENVSPISLTKKTSVYFVVLSVFIYLFNSGPRGSWAIFEVVWFKMCGTGAIHGCFHKLQCAPRGGDVAE